MPHWKSLQEKVYLGSWDLVDRDGKPKDFTLTIKSVKSSPIKTVERPEGKKEILVHFERAQKPWICNSTNAATIEGMYGADIDAWPGKPITLFATTTRVGKKSNVPCIRVRPVRPKGAPEPLEGREVDQAMRDAQNEAFEREPGVEG